MARSLLTMLVELEDGRTWEVDTDQRDAASYELQDFYQPGRPLAMQRFMAYRASVRQKLTNLSWPKFNEQCVEVVAADSAAAAPDPTVPDPSGAP